MATLAEDKPAFRHLSSIDLGLVLAVLLLSIVGLATVHSASSEMPVDYLPRQALWFGVGGLLLVAAMSIDYHVLLDFSGVLFIDSSGLRAMTALVRTAKSKGRTLRLSSDMPAHARRLMEIVGLLPFVPIELEDPRGEDAGPGPI